MNRTLSEADSAELLSHYGVPMAGSALADDPKSAADAAASVGFPVVVKLCGDGIAHKTERGLVRLGLTSSHDASAAAEELFAQATPEDGEVQVIVAPMISGNRELIAGISTDPQFGHTVMLGVGGVMAEAIADVVIRLVPITTQDAYDMIDGLETTELLGAFRGEDPVDRDAVAETLLALSHAAVSRPDIVSADCNPLIIHQGKPVAVDALVEVSS